MRWCKSQGRKGQKGHLSTSSFSSAPRQPSPWPLPRYPPFSRYLTTPPDSWVVINFVGAQNYLQTSNSTSRTYEFSICKKIIILETCNIYLEGVSLILIIVVIIQNDYCKPYAIHLRKDRKKDLSCRSFNDINLR